MVTPLNEQENIFDLYCKLNANIPLPGYGDLPVIATKFPAGEVIEMMLAIYAGSHMVWESTGGFRPLQERLIRLYGAELVPFLTTRILTPLHGGGTAYGEHCLLGQKRRVQLFCKSTLAVLRGESGDISPDELPKHYKLHRETGELIGPFATWFEAFNYGENDPAFKSWEYERIEL